MKLWGGRFAGETDKLAEDFHSSIGFDQRLYAEDIQGAIAHATMLGDVGIITKDESVRLVAALKEIASDIEAGHIEFDVAAEDIHMNIEQILTQRIGTLGKKLHTARSRNDQVALDTRLWLRKQIAMIEKELKDLLQVLLDQAKQHVGTVMPGFTHLQKAQPITFAHHLLAYVQMFSRDYQRFVDCDRRMDYCPLGCGALAGTTFPIDRIQTSKMLGFSAPTANSLDGVSDRDYALEFLSAASICMMHLSRFCEEIIVWNSQDYAFIILDDAYSTGSSIMPQKKNPDMAELIRGKTGRVYGDLFALFTVMKGLPLAYNKDMQEDKESLFDAVDTLRGCLSVFTPMIATLKVQEDRMANSASGGFINATDLADYLVRKGLPFREAHAVSGKMVLHCEKIGADLADLSLAKMQEFSPLFTEDVYDAISLSQCVAARKSLGGPAPEAVNAAIAEAEAWLQEHNDFPMGDTCIVY